MAASVLVAVILARLVAARVPGVGPVAGDKLLRHWDMFELPSPSWVWTMAHAMPWGNAQSEGTGFSPRGRPSHGHYLQSGPLAATSLRLEVFLCPTQRSRRAATLGFGPQPPWGWPPITPVSQVNAHERLSSSRDKPSLLGEGAAIHKKCCTPRITPCSRPLVPMLAEDVTSDSQHEFLVELSAFLSLVGKVLKII